MLSNDPRPLRHALVVARDVTAETAVRYMALPGGKFDVLAMDGMPDAREGSRAREFHGDGPAEFSDRTRSAVERQQRERRYNLIVFAGKGGLGARAIQAKRAGLAFNDVPLAVYLDGNSQRDREANRRWPTCFADVETDYLERWAFENADIQCIPDDDLTAFVKRNHWYVRPDAVKSLPSPSPLAGEGGQSAQRSDRVRGETSAGRGIAPQPTSPHTLTPHPVGTPEAFRPPSPARGEGQDKTPLVTVAIAHHNLGTYFPDTLATLARQTDTNFELIAIDDGSTDANSLAVFDQMAAKYPQWTFLKQPNAGIGATRNRCLELAKGEFFVPVDADNLACPDMLAKFVTAIRRNPEYAAMSCYFLAFDVDAPNLVPDKFLYALRPLGGPHALACIRNVYGDANAIFRTAALRSVGGYGTDRGTSCEDWEAFLKLVHAGHRLGVVPDHLFYYRHRPGGFSRSTNWFANHQRALRQFATPGTLSPADALLAWTALLGFHQELEHRATATPPRRHRFADRVYSALRRPLGWLKRKS